MDSLFEEVRASKKYLAVCDETVLRVCREEEGRYKSGKETVKAVKNKLHRICWAFTSEGEIRAAAEAMEGMDDPACRRRLLQAHASSRERLPFMEEFYGEIASNVRGVCRVLDIACGLNPIAATLFAPFDACEYDAVDINVKTTELLSRFYAKIGQKGRAVAGDVLYRLPGEGYDLVLLFKILPLLEQQKKGFSRELLLGLGARYAAVSFPTKTISGKNVGMFCTYSSFMQGLLEGLPYGVLLEREYPNELLYLLKRGDAG